MVDFETRRRSDGLRPFPGRGWRMLPLAVLLVVIVIGWIAVNGSQIAFYRDSQPASPIGDGEALPEFAPAGESATP